MNNVRGTAGANPVGQAPLKSPSSAPPRVNIPWRIRIALWIAPSLRAPWEAAIPWPLDLPDSADVNTIVARMRVLRSHGAKILDPSPANLATLEKFARQNDGIEDYGRDFLTSGETLKERVRVEDIIAVPPK